MAMMVQELRDKRAKLEALKGNRSKANCSSKHSSASDMEREMEIERLEEEIQALERKLGK